MWSLEVYFMRMWWYEFKEQTEEWYEVPSTGNGKAMPQRGIITEDD